MPNNYDLSDLGAIPVEPSISDKVDLSDLGATPVESHDLSDLGAVPLQEENNSIIEKAKRVATAISDWNKERVRKIEAGEANTGSLKQSDIDEIAKKHGVSKEFLTQSAPLYNIGIEGKEWEDTPGRIFGFFAQSIANGAPTWLMKKGQEDVHIRAALDDLAEKADTRKTKAQLGVEMLGGLLPVGAPGKAAKLGGLAEKAVKALDVAAPVAVAGAQGLFNSREGDEVSSAVLGAGLGGVLSGAMHMPKAYAGLKKVLGKDADKLAPHIIDEVETKIVPQVEKRLQDEAEEIAVTKKAILNTEQPLDEVSTKTIAKTERDLAAAIGEDIAEKTDEELAQKQINKFATYLDGSAVPVEGSAALIKEKIAQQGPEFIAKEFDNFKAKQITQKVIAENIDKGLGVRYNNNPVTKMLMVGTGNYSFAAPQLDRVLGGKFQPLLNETTEALNNFQITLAGQQNKIGKLLNVSEGMDEERLYAALNKGIEDGLSDKEKAVVSNWRNFFEESRQLENQLGLPTQKVKGGFYVPNVTVDIPEMISRINNKARELGVENGIGQTRMNELRDNPAFQDLMHAVEIASGNKVSNASQFNEGLIKGTSVPNVANREDTIATSAMMRQGDIPDFIREKNVGKLASKRAYGTLSHVFLRDKIAEARRLRNIAAEVGYEQGYKYLDNWINDMSGGTQSKSLAQAAKKARAFIDTKTKDIINNPKSDSLTRGAAQVLGSTPQVMPLLTSQMYPNLLGFSVKGVVANLLQPIMLGIPELGAGYGGSKLLKSYLELIPKLAKGTEITLSEGLANKLGRQPGEKLTTRSLQLILENEGASGGKFDRDALNALKGGIAQSAPYKMTQKTLDKWADFAMWAFSQSEDINRMVVRDTGKDIAKEFMQGGQGAVETVERMGEGVRRAVKKAAAEGNAAEVSHIIQNHLQSKVLFNYNKANMSQLGRWLGPTFAAFTKWPTEIAGDIANRFYEKGGAKGLSNNLKVYLAPLLALEALDTLTGAEENDRVNVVIGRDGFSKLGTAGNIGSILQGEVGKTPIVQTAGAAYEALKTLSSNPEKGRERLWKLTNSTARTWFPAASAVNFLTIDVPTLAGKKLPDTKKPWLERVNKGITNLEDVSTGAFQRILGKIKAEEKSQ